MSYFVLSILGIFVALLLLTVEVFLPTAGTVGLLAFLIASASIFAAFMHGAYYGAFFLLAILIALPFFFAAAVKIWPHTPIGRMILIGDVKEENVLPKDSHYVRIADQIGQVGIAKTKMYPSGIVIINEQRFDAVSKGFPIEAGEQVKVVSVEGNRLHVQKYEDNGQAETSNNDPQADELSQSLEELGIDDFDLGG